MRISIRDRIFCTKGDHQQLGEKVFIYIAIPVHTAKAFQTASNTKRPQYMVLMGITQISIKVTKLKVPTRRGSTRSINSLSTA